MTEAPKDYLEKGDALLDTGDYQKCRVGYAHQLKVQKGVGVGWAQPTLPGFLRFYGKDFEPETITKILTALGQGRRP